MGSSAVAIYLDHNATTPCDRRVVEKMLPIFDQVYGNPANGLHPQGRAAARAVAAYPSGRTRSATDWRRVPSAQAAGAALVRAAGPTVGSS